MLSDYETSLLSAAKRQVAQYESQKNTELRNKYRDDVRSEKVSIKEQLDTQLKVDKEK